MPLGIKPTVDFAFKKIFGSPENATALIGLLNAVLDLPRPIEKVIILNPFSYQEFAESKFVVLDVRCRDANGQWLNVEMQASAHAGLTQRLVYYACSMYCNQLELGESYSNATVAISICLLRYPLFRDTDQPHHRFQMVDVASGRELPNGTEVHTVELSKYELNEQTIATRPSIEQWAFLLLYAQDYEGERLRKILSGIAFETAIRTIEVISKKSEDRQMYDQRERAQRDYEWALTGAREEGREEGIEVGREQGCEVGMLVGKIQILQEILGESVGDDTELLKQDRDLLTSQLVSLQQRISRRDI